MRWKDFIGAHSHKGGLRRRLLLAGLSLLGGALILNTMAGLYYTRHLILRSSAQLQAEIATRVALEIEEFMEDRLTRLADLAASISLHGSGSDEQKQLAALLLKNERSFEQIAILDERGREALKVTETEIRRANELSDQSESQEFKSAMRGERYIGPVYTPNGPYMTLSLPIRAGSGKIIGVVIGTARLKVLWDIVKNIQFGRAGYAYVVDGTGTLIAYRDTSMVLERRDLSALPEVREFLRKPEMAGDAPAAISRGIDGEDVLSTHAPVKKLRWAVVLAEPAAVALSEIATVRWYAFLPLGMGLLLGGLGISGAANRITKPILELQRGIRSIGAGSLDHQVESESGDEIQELAEGFNKTALELKNFSATQEQKVDQRGQEVAALYDVSTALNKSVDVQGILSAVIAKITEIFHFEATRIFLFNDAMNELEMQASFEADLEYFRGTRGFKRGQGIVGHVANSGEALIFEDVWTDARYAALSKTKALQNAQRHFFAAFPIKNQSHVFGVMTFNGEAPRKLTGDEIPLITSMAEQVAVAVERARLFARVQTRSQHLTVLNEIGAAVSHSLDLEVILGDAVKKVVETLSFDACWIYILEPSEPCLRLRAQTGLSAETAQSVERRPVERGITGKIFETGQPLVSEDLTNDPLYQKISSASKVAELGFKSSAGFPVVANHEIQGVFHVVSYSRHQFTAEELQLLEAIAHTIGVAVENARLFVEVKDKTLELEKANQELREATRAKSEFIAAMSHELRTPLNIIIGHSELTRDGTFGAVNEQQQAAMQKISRNGRVLLKMINDVLMLSRIEAKKMSLDVATVEIEEVIEQAQTYVEQLKRDHHLEVSWHIDKNIPPVLTDSMKLEEILHNLIGNAFKYTSEGSIEVRVRDLPDKGRVEFSVADTGVGIDPANLGRIFEEFEQVKDSGKNGGVGLGLSIVKKYVELMQGDIRVESEPGKGSKFTFSIPRSVSLHS